MPAVNGLTMREKIGLKKLIEGKSPKQAALEAGYKAPNQIYENLAKPRIQSEFQKMLAKAGLTDDYIAQGVRELTEADKTIVIDNAPHECPDNSVRLNAYALACRLAGHLSPDINNTLNIQNNITIQDIDINTSQDSEAWTALKNRLGCPGRG